jgi:hypothetical protein
LRRKGLRDNMVKCFRKMDDGIKICVKCEDEELTHCIEQKRGVEEKT